MIIKGRELGPTSYSFFREGDASLVDAAKDKMARDFGVSEVHAAKKETGVRLEGDCAPGQVVNIARMLIVESVFRNGIGRRVDIGIPEAKSVPRGK